MMTADLTPEALDREALAALEHEQWMAWSQDIASKETLSAERLDRWRRLWVPYDQLTEDQKDMDREWADKVLAAARQPLLWLVGRARRIAALEAALPEDPWDYEYDCGICGNGKMSVHCHWCSAQQQDMETDATERPAHDPDCKWLAATAPR